MDDAALDRLRRDALEDDAAAWKLLREAVRHRRIEDVSIALAGLKGGADAELMLKVWHAAEAAALARTKALGRRVSGEWGRTLAEAWDRQEQRARSIAARRHEEPQPFNIMRCANCGLRHRDDVLCRCQQSPMPDPVRYIGDGGYPP